MSNRPPHVFRSPIGATISEPDPPRLDIDSEHDPSRTIIVERCGRARPLLRSDCFLAR